MKTMPLKELAMNRLPLHLGLLALPLAGALTAVSTPLDAATADAIVREEMTLKATDEAERRERILQVPAITEAVIHKGEETILLRRVARQDPPASRSVENLAIRPETSRKDAPPPLDRRPHKSLTLLITVLDPQLTEIRSLLHGEEGAQWITTLSKVDFSWLPGILTIESGSAVYTVFAIVERADQETGKTRPEFPSFFTSAPDEYIVQTEATAHLAAIDTLHRHYLAHKAEFEIDRRQAEALSAARKRQLERNPPEPRQTVINFAPVRSRVNE